MVTGFCVVNAGPAFVSDSLTVTPGSVLIAAFALNTANGQATSHLTVRGNLVVGSGGTMLLGCIPTSFPCVDDPNPSAPTLSSRGRVGGNLTELQPLGVIVHNSVIGGDVTESGGGGGFTCNPIGIFALFNSPAFSVIDDSTVGGDVAVTGLTGCYLGLARTHVGGDVAVLNDQLADPDAIEILANHIQGKLSCFHNSMVWDSSEATFMGPLWPRLQWPNTVRGGRRGQCDILENPTTQGGTPGPLPF